MAGIKNYIHYHNNMEILNKITDERLREMIKQEVNGIINIGSGRPEKLADRVERFIKENNYHIHLLLKQYIPDDYLCLFLSHL